MTLPLDRSQRNAARRANAPKMASRLVGAAAIACALTQANVATAGPAINETATTASAAAYAAPRAETSASRPSVEQQSLLVMIDHLERVSFTDQVRTVLVGNPAIADVTMISSREAVISARTVGSTNLFFLDVDGRAIGDFEVVVREGEARRVVLRHGPGRTELYQCAPRCERTLSQMDSSESHDELSRVVTTETTMTQEAATAAGDALQ